MNRALAVLAFGLVFVFDAVLPQPNPGVDVSQEADQKSVAPKVSPAAVVHRIDPKSSRYTRTATALRAIADSVKACPRIVEFDGSKDNEKPEGPLAQARLYYGPPVNVTWVASSGPKAPMQEGYVQFSLPRELWIPPEIRNQWANEVAAVFSEMIEDMPSLEYRYKFHVGSDRVRLTEILVRSARQHEWKEAPAREKTCSQFGCAPVCWQSAGQSGQISAHIHRRLARRLSSAR